MQAVSEAKRPALTYYGGKWRLAPWIIQHFPTHSAYVEPCGGAASVLLQKPRSPLETYNDLDGLVVNFWRVLRDNPNELIRKIRLTPWSRLEYDLSLEPCDDPIESARRFWVLIQMSIVGSHGYHPGFRIIKSAKHIHKHPDLFDKDLEGLNFAYKRLIGVQIENLDAIECIQKYDGQDTLIYFDPPYLAETRTQHTRYNLEANEGDFHTKAATVLLKAQGYVVISGYISDLYQNLYEQNGWKRFDKRSQINNGGHRIESVWLSPRTAAALGKPKQGALFDVAGAPSA